MTNIFQRIGNNFEKKKLERKKMGDKYWKLSSIERIDYDNHIENIKKKYDWFWVATILWIKLMIYIAIFFGLFGLIFNKFDVMINLVKILWSSFIKIIWLPISIDIIFVYSNIFFEERDEKDLNKRFKLC